MRFYVYCLAFCFEFDESTQEKLIIRSIFNLGLAATRFLTTRPILQQGNLTLALDPIANQQLISGSLKKHVTLINSKLEEINPC